MFESIPHGARRAKKAVILILIDLTYEAESKSREERETEIRKAVEKCLESIPWIVVKNIITVEE